MYYQYFVILAFLMHCHLRLFFPFLILEAIRNIPVVGANDDYVLREDFSWHYISIKVEELEEGTGRGFLITRKIYYSTTNCLLLNNWLTLIGDDSLTSSDNITLVNIELCDFGRRERRRKKSIP